MKEFKNINMNCIGIDIGGTKIALGKYDLSSWTKLSEERTPTKSSGSQEEFLDQVTELIKKHIDSETQSIGIGVPGPVHNNIISKLPNIPNITNLNLSKEIQKRLPTSFSKTHTQVENDANCFLVGAWHLEDQKDHRNVTGIIMGTGVGGGMIINNKLIRGKDGVAGEFGHMVLRDQKTLQELVSGKALSRRWYKEFKQEKSGEEIVKSANKGNKESLGFLKKIGQDLALALGNIILVCNPDLIFFGGSASAALPFMLSSIEKHLKAIRYPNAGKVPLVRASNPDCATFGAAWLSKKNR